MKAPFEFTVPMTADQYVALHTRLGSADIAETGTFSNNDVAVGWKFDPDAGNLAVTIVEVKSFRAKIDSESDVQARILKVIQGS